MVPASTPPLQPPLQPPSHSAQQQQHQQQHDEEVQLAAGRALKKKAQSSSTASKRNLARAGPRGIGGSSSSSAAAAAGPVRQHHAASMSDEEYLQACNQLYSTLPKSSAWARHKLKVVSKAIELLKRGRAARTAAQAAELQQLLASLQLQAPAAGRTGATPAGQQQRSDDDTDMQQQQQQQE